MNYTDFANPFFKRAVDAIDTGDVPALTELLNEYPQLINEQANFPDGGYFERPYLIYFVADNPIRHEAIPGNVLDILGILIEKVNQFSIDRLQQLDYTLGLIASGRIPKESGKQIAMMDALLDAGASPGDGAAALAHGNLEAARHLIKRGGSYTLLAAVCFDEADKVKELAGNSTKEELLTALTAAAFYGKPTLISLLLSNGASPDGYPANGFHTHATPLHQAVYSGNLASVQLLVKAGANAAATDKAYNGTPLGWSMYMQTETTDAKEKDAYKAIENYLRQL